MLYAIVYGLFIKSTYTGKSPKNAFKKMRHSHCFFSQIRADERSSQHRYAYGVELGIILSFPKTLSTPLQDSFRFLRYPLPAVLSACLAACFP